MLGLGMREDDQRASLRKESKSGRRLHTHYHEPRKSLADLRRRLLEVVDRMVDCGRHLPKLACQKTSSQIFKLGIKKIEVDIIRKSL